MFDAAPIAKRIDPAINYLKREEIYLLIRTFWLNSTFTFNVVPTFTYPVDRVQVYVNPTEILAPRFNIIKLRTICKMVTSGGTFKLKLSLTVSHISNSVTYH